MLGFLSGHRPDITPAQGIGFVCGAVGPVCALLGVHLSPEQVNAVDQLKVLGLGLFGADAAIRIGRNHKDGKVQAAALTANTQPPDALASVNLGGKEIAKAVSNETGKVESNGLTTEHVPEEAPFSEDEIDSLPPEVSSDPEADAIDPADLPSYNDEELTIGSHTPEEVQ